MADAYEIQHCGKAVGDVQLEKRGLYLYFSCRCRLPDDGMYRIHACDGDKWEDLGICVPVEGVFGMDKRIPAKRFGEGKLTFRLVPKDWQPEEPASVPEPAVYEEEQSEEPAPVIAEPAEDIFLPVSEEEPFAQLDMLENAVMEVRDDQAGIVIKE